MERENIIVMNSLTQAQRTKDALSTRGIRARLVKTPENMRKSGCGYSLYVPDNTARARQIIKSLFEKKGDGT